MPQAIYAQQGGGGNRGGVGVGIGVGGGALTSLFDSAVKGAGSAIGGGVQSLLSDAIMGPTPAQVAAELTNSKNTQELIRDGIGRGQSYEDLVAANPNLDISREAYDVQVKDPLVRDLNRQAGEIHGLLDEKQGKAPQYAPVAKEAPSQPPADETSLTGSLISADGSAPTSDAPQEDMSMAPTQVTPEAFYSPTNDSYQAGPAGGMETGGNAQAGETAWNVQEHLKGVPQNTILKQVAKEKLIHDSMLNGQIDVAVAKYRNNLIAMNSQQQTSMSAVMQTQQAQELYSSFEMTKAQLDQRSMMLGIAPDVWETKPATYLGAKYDLANPQELDAMRAWVEVNKADASTTQQREQTKAEIAEREQNVKDAQAWEAGLTGTEHRQVQDWSKSVIVSRPAASKSGYFAMLAKHESTQQQAAKAAKEAEFKDTKLAYEKQRDAANRAVKVNAIAGRLGIQREKLDLQRQTVEGTLRHQENMDARQEKLYQLNVTRTNAELLRKKGEITPRDVFMAGMKSTANHETLLNRSLATLAKEEGDFLRVNPSAPTSPERKKQYEAQKAEFKSRREAINSSMAGVREQQSYLLERAGSAAGSLQSSATSDPVSPFPRTSPEYYEQLGVDFGDMPDQDQVTTSKFIDTMLSRPRTPIKNGPRQPTPEELSSILNNPASVEKLKAMNMGVELTPANVSKILAAYREAYLVDGARK